MKLRVYEKNNVRPHVQNAFLADCKGLFDFLINRKSLHASSIFKDTGEIVRVPQFILIETIEAIRPDFLSKDIEGSEYDIFRMINFKTIKKIKVELHPSILGEAKMIEIFNLLKVNGFLVDISMPDGRNYFFKRKLA